MERASDFQSVQNQHERERKKLERENKRTLKQFESIREQVKDKERSVKMEIERVLQDWEDKCIDLEQREADAISKCEKALGSERKIQAEYQALSKELRAVKMALDDAKDELKLIQQKYEEKLDQKEAEKLEIKAKQMQLLDKSHFEVEYLKRELENQLKQKEQLLIERDRGSFPIVGQVYGSTGKHQDTPQLEALREKQKSPID